MGHPNPQPARSARDNNKKQGIIMANRRYGKFGICSGNLEEPNCSDDHLRRVSALTSMLETAVVGTTIEGHSPAVYRIVAEDLFALLATIDTPNSRRQVMQIFLSTVDPSL